MPSLTGCSQSIGAVSRARVRGTQAPVRVMRRYPAYQTIAVVASTCRPVQSHPAAPNGIIARGMASTAANGG